MLCWLRRDTFLKKKLSTEVQSPFLQIQKVNRYKAECNVNQWRSEKVRPPRKHVAVNFFLLSWVDL